MTTPKALRARVAAAPRRRVSLLELRRMVRSREVVAGLVLLALTTLVAVLGPVFAPFSPSEIVTTPFAPPSDGVLLGGDVLGRDVLSRVLHGGRDLIVMSFAATILGVGLGAVVGLVSAYARGVVDVVIMRLMDVLLSFPTVILALLFVAMLGASPWILVAVVAVSHLPSVARVIRGAASSVVDGEHVLWARSVGLPGWRILASEVAPLVTSPLMVEFGLRLMWSVGALASLSFLGYGVQPPAADWGLMVSENGSALSFRPLPVIVPIACVAVFTIGGNLVTEGIARVVARTDGGR